MYKASHDQRADAFNPTGQAVDPNEVLERGIAKKPDVAEPSGPAVLLPRHHRHKHAQHKRAVKKKKKKIKVITFNDFRCRESYNGLVDSGICRTLAVQAPTLVSEARHFDAARFK